MYWSISWIVNHQPIGCRRTAALFQGCIISFATSDFGKSFRCPRTRQGAVQELIVLTHVEFYYIPRKAYEFAQLRDVEITLATAIEEFTVSGIISHDGYCIGLYLLYVTHSQIMESRATRRTMTHDKEMMILLFAWPIWLQKVVRPLFILQFLSKHKPILWHARSETTGQSDNHQ